MDLGKRADAVMSRHDFAAFVDALRHDLAVHPEEWENPTLDTFLEALSAWVRDMDGYYRNKQLPTPQSPTWKSVAEMMLAAKVYE